MNLNSDIFLSPSITNFFFKAFAIIFSFLYLIFSLTILDQVRLMGKIFRSSRYGIVIFISRAQFLMAIILLIMAIVLL